MSGVIYGTMLFAFFFVFFSLPLFASLRILISFVSRRDSGYADIRKEKPAEFRGREEDLDEASLIWNSVTQVSATRTTTSTLSAQRPFSLEDIAAHIVAFFLHIFFEKKLHTSWLYFVPPCFFFFSPTLLTIFHLTHGFTWALFVFVFFVFHLISEQGCDE